MIQVHAPRARCSRRRLVRIGNISAAGVERPPSWHPVALLAAAHLTSSPKAHRPWARRRLTRTAT